MSDNEMALLRMGFAQACEERDALRAEVERLQSDTVAVPRELAGRLCHRDNYTRQMARRELRTLLAGEDHE